jgi:hypothetical protein
MAFGDNFKFGEIGILQIGNERYGFRPFDMTREYACNPILRGEILENMFLASNRKAKADELRDPDRGGICNKDYGLLEKSDRINYLEIEDDEKGLDYKIMVVRDRQDDVIGYITGVTIY